MFFICSKGFKIDFQNRKWNYPNRKWNYFSHFQASYQKTSFTKCFSFDPRVSKLIFKIGNGISKQEMELFLPFPGLSWPILTNQNLFDLPWPILIYLTYLNLSWPIFIYLDLSSPISIYLNISGPFLTYLIYLNLSWPILTNLYLSWPVLTCFD